MTEFPQVRREPSDTQRVHLLQSLELEWHPASSQPVPGALLQQLLRHDTEAAVRTQHPPLWRRFRRPVLDFGTAMVGDRVHLRMLLFNRGQLPGSWTPVQLTLPLALGTAMGQGVPAPAHAPFVKEVSWQPILPWGSAAECAVDLAAVHSHQERSASGLLH